MSYFNNAKPLTIGMVVGEQSGDTLAAELIKQLKKKYAHFHFVGIGGPKMISEGFETLYPMESLSVFGISEVIKKLPELLRIRSNLKVQFEKEIRPIVFIGIDAPDFNIPLEAFLKKKGITTIHYVSPSVWAWRPKRIFQIKKAIDHMLTLFPVESKFYQNHNMPVTCVGHTLADTLPIVPDMQAAREKLNLAKNAYIVALLPGSRKGEVSRLLPVMLEAAIRFSRLYRDNHKKLLFIIPSANELRFKQIEKIITQQTNINVQLYENDSHNVLIACDQVLISSGTATLEAMMAKKPMVVCYKETWLSWHILKNMIKVQWIALPNLIANKLLVPEFIQHRATPENLSQALFKQMQNNDYKQQLCEYFIHYHKVLKKDASHRAAEVVIKYVKQHL